MTELQVHTRTYVHTHLCSWESSLCRVLGALFLPDCTLFIHTLVIDQSQPRMYRMCAVTPPSLNVEKVHYRWLLVKLLWQHIVAVSSAYFVTLLLYPGISTLVQDCSLDDWTPIILVLLFGITDLLGKVCCAVLWCGVVCGDVVCCVCAVLCCGVVWCVVMWYVVCVLCCGVVWCVVMWYVVCVLCCVVCGVCCVVVWCGVVWRGVCAVLCGVCTVWCVCCVVWCGVVCGDVVCCVWWCAVVVWCAVLYGMVCGVWWCVVCGMWCGM